MDGEPWMRFEIPYHIRSQNDWQHANRWKIREDRHMVQRVVRGVVGFLPEHGLTRRWMRITSLRPRLITDHANLVGGCKGLVDALVSCGLAYDDADEWLTVEYAQEKLVRGKRTRVEVW